MTVPQPNPTDLPPISHRDSTEIPGVPLVGRLEGSPYLRLWARSWYEPTDGAPLPFLVVLTSYAPNLVDATVSDTVRLCIAMTRALRGRGGDAEAAFSATRWAVLPPPNTLSELVRVVREDICSAGEQQALVIKEHAKNPLPCGAYVCEGMRFVVVRHKPTASPADATLESGDPLDFLLWISGAPPGGPSAFLDVPRGCAVGHEVLPVGWQRHLTRRMAALLVSTPPSDGGYGTFPSACRRTAQALARRGYVLIADHGVAILLQRSPRGEAAVAELRAATSLWGKDQPLEGLGEMWDRHLQAGGSRVAWVDSLPGSTSKPHRPHATPTRGESPPSVDPLSDRTL